MCCCVSFWADRVLAKIKCPKYFFQSPQWANGPVHKRTIWVWCVLVISEDVCFLFTSYLSWSKTSGSVVTASMVDSRTHPGTFFQVLPLSLSLCVCGWPCSHALQQGSVEAERWQVDPYQSPLSLQGSNCSRPQTFTFDSSHWKNAVPASFTEYSYMIVQFKDRIGVSLVVTVKGPCFQQAVCKCIRHACFGRSQPDCHSWGKHFMGFESCPASVILPLWKLYSCLFLIKLLYYSQQLVDVLHADIKSFLLLWFQQMKFSSLAASPVSKCL